MTDPDVDIAGANAKLDLLLDKQQSVFPLLVKVLAFALHIIAVTWAGAAFYWQVQGLEKADRDLKELVDTRDAKYKESFATLAQSITENSKAISNNASATTTQLTDIKVQLGKIEAILSYKPKDEK